MSGKIEYELCRLCLNSGGLLINIFEQNSNFEFMLEKTIEDLIDVKVVADTNYPWLVCSNCTVKLTEFRLFKRRCAECLFVFYNRIQKECNPSTEHGITNREEEESDVKSHDNKGVERPGEESVEGTSGKVWAFSSPVEKATAEMEGTYSVGSQLNWMANNNCNRVEIQGPGGVKEDFGDDAISSDTIVNKPVDVRGDMVIVKEEVDDASGCCATPEKDVDWSVVPSMKDEGSHWSDSDVSGNVDHSEDRELRLSFNEEVDIKEESDVEIPKADGGLAGHMHVHAPEKSNKCTICLRVFSDRSNLRRHMYTHTGEWLHKCEICSKGFQQRTHLKQHVLTHTGERPHECEICSKSFALKQTLMRHMRVHCGEKSHKCAVCSQAFSHQSNLRRHMLTHTGEKPHKCDICSKGFHQKQHLKVHMLNRHTGEKANKCDLCSKSFPLEQMLKDHASKHAGEKSHKCTICSRAFLDKSNLRRHMLSHSDDRPYKCGICPKGFKHKSDLMRHKKLHKQVITD